MKLFKIAFFGFAYITAIPLIHTHSNIDCTHIAYQKHPLQPLIKDGRFYNNHQENRFTHISDAAKIFWATKTSTAKYFTSDHMSWIQKDSVIDTSDDLAVQWIGHASFLLQINGFNVITDPVFYDLNIILYPRKTPVGIDPEKLPTVDFVIISHNHRDHLDESSMKTLKKHQPIMLVPQGTKEWFVSRGFDTVIEHTWWQTETFTRDNRSIQFTFTPAVHWSGRQILDTHASLWGGWLIQSRDKKIYFAGDTGFNEPMFKAIKEYAQTIDCALLPIGPCEPRDLMHHSHMGPDDAVIAYTILQPKLCIPMHWGTFGLGPDSFDTPIKQLNIAWEAIVPQESQAALYKIKFGERLLVA